MDLDSIDFFPGTSEATERTAAQSRSVSARERLDADRFVAELAQAAAVEVRVVDGIDCFSGAERGFLVCASDVVERSHAADKSRFEAMAHRIVVIDVSRPFAAEYAARYGVAAVIGSDVHFRWHAGYGDPDPATIWGRLEVARKLGCVIQSGSSADPYVLIRLPAHAELPELLAVYLRACRDTDA